jgi:hypothetical protein
VRRQFEAELEKPPAESVEAASPYPERVAHCEICNWYSECEKRWVKRRQAQAHRDRCVKGSFLGAPPTERPDDGAADEAFIPPPEDAPF